MDVRQLSDRVGCRGEHGVERQQVLDRHRLGSELEPEQTEVQEDRLVQDQVRAGQECDDTVVRVSISRTGSDMASIIATRTLLL